MTDNVLFGYTGPLSGGRSRWEVEHSWGDISRTTAFVDWRHYYNIRQRYVFAVRGIGAASSGRDPEFFRVGGPYTYRGAGWGDLVGTRLGIGNFEFRFPLIERLQFVWPLALDFRGIQGVLFWDTEATWTDDRSFHLWRDGRLGDVQAAYGFGARLNLGLFILRYDIAQATDLAQKVGGTRHFFTIGGDF